MYLAIIITPLLGSILSGFFGRKIGINGAQLITSCFTVFTTILALAIFYEVGFNNIPVSIKLFKWIDSDLIDISWSFNFDSLTVSMLIPVLIVSSLVHIYSIGYMNNDPHNQRFFSYLSLFTFMMIILVTANNFLLMFVGWEGVGICSYLLVNFWFTRIAANQSSISALLTNRVGDCFLTIGMFVMICSFGNIDYTTVFSLSPYISENLITIVGLCLLIGAMAKSSQIGLHVWLPMAMEGPTPVSALIHAATMVTAGVYLLMRVSPLIEYSSTILIICLLIGAFTTVFSSVIGLFQQDIKKVIAYSTMSRELAQEHNKFIMFRHQTICVEIIYNIINSQITKARKYFKDIYNNINIINSFIKYFWLSLLSIEIEIWNILIISKLVGISEAIRLILISLNFYNKNNLTPFLNTSKLFQHSYEFKNSYNGNKDNDFNQWLAGLIDGDGQLSLSKKGLARLQIVMGIKDKKVLYEILHKFGGSIKPISNAYGLRYILSNKTGLKKLINAINGQIRNPTRLLQLNKLCIKYNIELIYPEPLTYYNGWFSGFLDSDGSVYLNEHIGQVIISITQKNIYLLQPLIKIYGGKIEANFSKGECFQYLIFRKIELFNVIDKYFSIYNLKTLKQNRINLVKQFYKVKIDVYNKDIYSLNEWVKFKENWDNFRD